MTDQLEAAMRDAALRDAGDPASGRVRPDDKRRRLRRRRAVAIVVLIALLVSGTYVTGSLVLPLPATAAVTPHVSTIVQPAAKLAWPGFGESAVTALDYPGVDEANGSTASVPIASVTKTITALVVLDRRPLKAGDDGPMITFGSNDVAIFNQVVSSGGSWAPVTAGTSMTEKQALTAMLLPSANNYAISLANWAYGSVPNFLAAANIWAQKHGLLGTHLVDATGFDPGSVSSTKDLVAVGKLVLADPVLPSIVSQKQATLPGAGVQDNTNVLLGIDGIDGIKTGNTDQAGNCLMFTARLQFGARSVRILGVVLGAPTHDALWAAVQALLTSVRDGFHEVDVSTSGQAFGSYTTPWKARTALVTRSRTTDLVWSNTPVTVAVESRPLQTGTAKDVAGRVSFTLNGVTQTALLSLKKALPDPGVWWRLQHPGGFGAP